MVEPLRASGPSICLRRFPQYLDTHKEIGPHKVVRIRDLGTGVDTATADQKATLPPVRPNESIPTALGPSTGHVLSQFGSSFGYTCRPLRLLSPSVILPFALRPPLVEEHDHD